MKNILMLFITVLFCNGSCESKEGQSFVIQNNSEKEIIIVWSFYLPIPNDSMCIKPKTNIEYEELIHSSMVEPHSSRDFERNRVGEEMISHPDDTLYIGVFNLIDIDTMSCEEFELEFPIKHEWKVTLADMEACNWTLVYPDSGN